jgi:hypothetical protein
VALGLFGTLGWVMSDGEWYFRLLMGFLSAASAVVIPLTIPALGRSALSYVLLLPMAFFGGVGAYSFHHAVETLVEHPRIEAHVASLADLKQVWTTAQTREADAVAKLAAYPTLALDPLMPAGRVRAQQAAWEGSRKPLAEMVQTTTAATAKAKAEYDAKVSGYTPMLHGNVVWFMGVLMDLSLAMGFIGLEDAHRRQQRKLAEERAAARKARAEAAAKAAEAEANAQALAAKAAEQRTRRAKRMEALSADVQPGTPTFRVVRNANDN